MGYKHLTREQRYTIEALLQTPMSLREIGEVIGVSCSLVLSRYFSKYNLGVSVGLHDLTHGRSSYKTYTTGAPSFLQEQREQRLGRYLRIDLRYSFGRFRAHTSVAHKSYDME